MKMMMVEKNPFFNNSLFVGFGIYSLSLLLLTSLTRLFETGSFIGDDACDDTGEFEGNKEFTNDLKAFTVWFSGWTISFELFEVSDGVGTG